MAYNKVTIANMALQELGAARIVNFTDGSANAGRVSAVWDLALETALTLHPWNFAIKRRADVAERASAPAWGFDYAYTYPSDCLHILSIGQDGVELPDVPFQTEIDADTEERIIVTDLKSPIDIKYIYRATDPQRFSPPFVLALVKVLKSMLARPVTGKADVKAEADKEMKEVSQAAKSSDGKEGTPLSYTPLDLEVVR